MTEEVDEYEEWKESVPDMYDFVSETKLTWPSLTVQWLPGIGAKGHEFLLGTHTSGEEENFLKIAAIKLPDNIEEDTDTQMQSDPKSINNPTRESKIRILRKFVHEDEVTRARYMPHASTILATLSGSGKIHVYDRNSEGREAVQKLSYHTENGYGLAFSPTVEGRLCSGSDDGTLAVWDLGYVVNDNRIGKSTPVCTFNKHTGIVNDCQWQQGIGNGSSLIGSVGEDCTVRMHDMRSGESQIVTRMKSPLNTIAFSPHAQNLYVGGGEDQNVHIFDARKAERPVHSMNGHTGQITSLQFCRWQDGLLGSCGEDKKVILWDLREIGAEQQQEDALDGPPELFMVHGGHRSVVNEFSFNEEVPWLVASVEEDNVAQIWKVGRGLVDVARPNADYDIYSLE